MEQLTKFITAYYPVIFIAMLSVFVIGLMIFIYIIVGLNKMRKQYKTIVQGVEGKNLEELLMHNGKTLEQVLLQIRIVEDRITALETIQEKTIQKVGMLRFNAFSDMGGEQSFALALLDKNNAGVVISSIYGRDDARTYAKPIKSGTSTYKLSQEERNAIDKAINGK